MRVGVLRDLFRKGAEFEAGNAVIDKQIGLLRDGGAVVVDGLPPVIDLPSADADASGQQLRAAAGLRCLSRLRPAAPVKTLAELIATGKYLKGGTRERRFNETMKVGELDTNVEYLSRLEKQRVVRRLLIGLMDRTGSMRWSIR